MTPTGIKNNTFTLCLILSVVFISYLPSLQNGFVHWDDYPHLIDNPSVRTLDFQHLHDIFTTSLQTTYIPLTILSFAVEYHFSGLNAFVYHLDNLLLHLAVTACVYFLAMRLGLSLWASAVASLLFGLHPLHVESVAWVTERKDVLCGFFYLLSLLTYCRFLRDKNLVYFFIALFLGALSMLAKPMALSLPLILFLFDWFLNRKFSWGTLVEKIPFFAVLGALGWLTYSAHMRVPVQSLAGGLLFWIWSFIFYLKQFLFPFILVPLYSLPLPVVLSNTEYLFSLISFMLLIGLFILSRRNRWLIFALSYYILSIFFLLRFDSAKDLTLVADRFMYLPSLGLCFFVGYMFQILHEKASKFKTVYRKIFPAMGIFLILLLSATKTFAQCQVWHNTFTLWQHELKYFPDNHVALTNLATFLADQPDFGKAKAQYLQVASLTKKGGPTVLTDEEQQSVDKVNDVVRLYERAAQAAPQYPDVHYNLGKVLEETGHPQEARQSYQNAINIYPSFKDAPQRLAGLKDEGMIQPIKSPDIQLDDLTPLKKNPPSVLTQSPENPETVFLLATEQEKQGDLDKAAILFAKVIELDPTKSEAYRHLGDIYGSFKKYDEAKRFYRDAVKMDTGNAVAYYHLGYIEEVSGSLKDALEAYQKATELDPKNIEAFYNLGNVYKVLNLEEKAKETYLKVVEAKPNHMDAWANLSIVSYSQGNYADAMKYLDKAKAFGYNPPNEYVAALQSHLLENSK